MRPTVLKLTAGFLFFCGLVPAAKSQSARPINVVTTAVPFLRISPDARAGGMGDIGVATSPDAASGFWNMGKDFLKFGYMSPFDQYFNCFISWISFHVSKKKTNSY